MKIAFISDIHGNPLALEAVLEDIQTIGGVDETWYLGDYAAIGPEPVRAVEMIHQIPHVSYLRGNTDRYLVTGERPKPRREDLERNPHLEEVFRAIADGFDWTLERLNRAGWMDWFRSLPLDQRTTLPDGTRLLAVHASPGKDDGPGVPPTISDADLADLVAGAQADLILVGHTHWPLNRTVNGIQVVNLGSVSNPFAPDLRASYVLLNIDQNDHQVDHRRVDYDHEKFIELTLAVNHPAEDYIIRYQTGQNRPAWVQQAELAKETKSRPVA
ncbi:MAG TPA: metallophosphoesterase family protein [Anaerolineaceae bacterium]|nr:metallophosphoesterase family protein [Anaerolineaceae bacterium]